MNQLQQAGDVTNIAGRGQNGLKSSCSHQQSGFAVYDGVNDRCLKGNLVVFLEYM